MKIKKHQIFETATFFTLSIKFITSEPFFLVGNFKPNFWLKVMICFRIGPVSAMT
jgi:hypothetical protein